MGIVMTLLFFFGLAIMTMIGRIAKTILQTGADNKVAATDVYSESPETKPLTTVVDFSKSFGKDIMNAATWLGSHDGAISLLKSLTVDSKGKISLDSKSLTKRLIEASGGTNSPFNDLSTKAADTLIKTLGGYVGSDITTFDQLKNNSNVAVLYKGVKTVIDKGELDNASDLVTLLNGIIKDDQIASILDASAQFAVLGNILEEASRLGIPDFMDTILEDITDDKEKRRFQLEQFDLLVKHSDLDAIEKVIDNVGKSAIRAKYPNATQDILRYFRIPYDYPSNNYGTLSNRLINLLNSLDSNWAIYSRNGTTISNLEIYSTASTDGAEMLKIHTSYRIPAMIASSYPSRDIWDILKKDYPMAAGKLS